MLNSKLIIFICIFLLNIANVNSQIKNNTTFDGEKYYYYKGKKIYLNEVNDRIFITFKRESFVKNNFSLPKNFTRYFNHTELDFHNTINAIKYHLIDNSKFSIGQYYNIIKELKSSPDILCVHPGYTIYNINSKTQIQKDISEEKTLYVTNQIIFKKKNEVDIQTIEIFLNKFDAKIIKTIPMGFGIEIILVSINGNSDVFDVANSLYETDLVEFSQPNFTSHITVYETQKEINSLKKPITKEGNKIHLNKNPETPDPPKYEPNDELFGIEWNLENSAYPGCDIQAPQAWYLEKGGFVVVAVLDGQACDITHPELQDKYIYPWNSHNGNADVLPRNGGSSDKHLTRISGFVAAKTDNVTGIASVGFKNLIMPVVFGYNPWWGEFPGWDWNDADFTDACSHIIQYSEIPETPIVAMSCSWQTDYFNMDQVMETDLQTVKNNGRNGHGIHIVFSSGNDDEDKLPYPAKLDFVISVGGTDQIDYRWWENGVDGSNYGDALKMVAPCFELETLDNTSAYGGDGYAMYVTGTSYAAPQVAAAIGLMYSYNLTLSFTEVEDRLLGFGVDKIHINGPGPTYSYDNNHAYGLWNSEVGYGRLNLYKCLSGLDHIPYQWQICENVSIGQNQTQTYEAVNYIQAPCNALYTFTISNGGTCNFITGSSMWITPGFTANEGSTFSAYIDPNLGNVHKTLARNNNVSYKVQTNKFIKDQIDSSVSTKKMNISQNYPNPFNPTTTIFYTLPTDNKVTIKIYNILGQEISKLVDEYKKAGSYSIDFDGSKYSSGIYIYEIKSGDFKINKRMALIK